MHTVLCKQNLLPYKINSPADQTTATRSSKNIWKPTTVAQTPENENKKSRRTRRPFWHKIRIFLCSQIQPIHKDPATSERDSPHIIELPKRIYTASGIWGYLGRATNPKRRKFGSNDDNVRRLRFRVTSSSSCAYSRLDESLLKRIPL